jgi:hypothetical protein
MAYVHACIFCGWSRPAASATIMAPHCEGCGCVLVSSPERPPSPSALPSLPGARPIPAAVGWLVKGLAAAAVIAAGTKVGYDAGGFWLAGAGFSVSGLLAVPPLMPESKA